MVDFIFEASATPIGFVFEASTELVGFVFGLENVIVQVGSPAGTINVYIDGVLTQSIASADLDAEEVEIFI